VGEGGADVVDGGLSGFDVEGAGFEEDVGLGGFQPGVDILIRFSRSGRGRPLSIQRIFYIQAIGISEPAEAAGGDAGDTEGDSVAGAEFGLAVFE
jgi:hypothetical protein